MNESRMNMERSDETTASSSFVAGSTLNSTLNPDIRAYGCRINEITAEELIDRYTCAGFLYPSKMDQMAPFLDQILKNWNKALRCKEILRCYTFDQGDDWGSVTTWRTTTSGVQAQHLVSIGSPVCSRAVILAGQVDMCYWKGIASSQNWYRRENRFPGRVFGTLEQSIGSQKASTISLQVLKFPRSRLSPGRNVSVRTVTDQCSEALSKLIELAVACRGSIYASAEGFQGRDIEMQELNQIYLRAGLYRYRKIYVANMGDSEQITGAAIVYRGPLGMNFSFLENRCDLLIHPGLAADQKESLAASLLSYAVTSYEGFELSWFPLVVNAADSEFLGIPLERLRSYDQTIWLKTGFEGFYHHVDGFYDRIISRNKRHGLARTTA